MHALIDFDIICYRVGYACQKSIHKVFNINDPYGEGVSVAEFNTITEAKKWINGEEGYTIITETTADSIANCLHSVKVSVDKIIQDLGVTQFTGYLSGKNNFREAIATIRPYKGNRDRNKKPIHYNSIREYLIKYYGAIVVDGIEADDALAIAHLKEEQSIICTIDKDLDQIPGWHYNFVTKIKYIVTEQEAIENFYKQLLKGDVVDNIVGVPGIGDAKATKLIQKGKTKEEYELLCKEKYKEVYGERGEEVLLENARLLYILRKPNELWDLQKKK
jgi:hypothetical protein